MYRKWKVKVVIIQEGTEPLPRCDHCGMHMPVEQLIKHIHNARCDKVTEMQLIWRDMDMVERCGEMDLILYRREGGKLVCVGGGGGKI